MATLFIALVLCLPLSLRKGCWAIAEVTCRTPSEAFKFLCDARAALAPRLRDATRGAKGAELRLKGCSAGITDIGAEMENTMTRDCAGVREAWFDLVNVFFPFSAGGLGVKGFSVTERMLLKDLLLYIETASIFCLNSLSLIFAPVVGYPEVHDGTQKASVLVLQRFFSDVVRGSYTERCVKFQMGCEPVQVESAGYLMYCQPSPRRSKVEESMRQIEGMYAAQNVTLERAQWGTERTFWGDKSATMHCEACVSIGYEGLDLFLWFADVGFEAQAVQRIFVIGNGFGLSALALAQLFKPASVDVLDPGVQWRGLELTRTIALAAGMDVAVYQGHSPADVPAAVRGAPYQLAFIDGLHTEEQVRQDFEAIRPYLANNCIVVVDDIWDIVGGLAEIGRTNTDFVYSTFHSPLYSRRPLGIFARGYEFAIDF